MITNIIVLFVYCYYKYIILLSSTKISGYLLNSSASSIFFQIFDSFLSFSNEIYIRCIFSDRFSLEEGVKPKRRERERKSFIFYFIFIKCRNLSSYSFYSFFLSFLKQYKNEIYIFFNKCAIYFLLFYYSLKMH